LLKSGALECADKDGRVVAGRRLGYLGLAHRTQIDLTRERKAHCDRRAETTGETSPLCILEDDKHTLVLLAPTRGALSESRRRSQA